MKQFVALAVFACISTTVASAAFDAFLKIEGIDGEVNAGGITGAMGVADYSWGVSNTSVGSSGVATGKRVHKPLTFVKQIDKASPLLYKSCATGKHYDKATLVVRSSDGSGRIQLLMQYELEDVIITSVHVAMGDVNGDGTAELTEQVTITFSKISWTHVPSQTTESDTVR